MRVGNDNRPSRVQRRVDLVERRNLLAEATESTAGERLQVVGVGGHRHLHRGMIEFAAHGPDEFAGAATGDHRTVGHAGDLAIEVDQLRCSVIGVQQYVGRFDGLQSGDHGGSRPVAIHTGAEVHVDAAAGVAALWPEVERRHVGRDEAGHGVPPGLHAFICLRLRP
jgi:hypothetical protein